jgi:rRNA maturation endonuclease Nob1
MYDPETLSSEKEVCSSFERDTKEVKGYSMYACECGEIIAHMKGHDCPHCGSEIL